MSAREQAVTALYDGGLTSEPPEDVLAALKAAGLRVVEDEPLPTPTTIDGSWTVWTGDGWVVLLSPAGIQSQITPPRSRASARAMASALLAAAAYVDPAVAEDPEGAEEEVVSRDTARGVGPAVEAGGPA